MWFGVPGGPITRTIGRTSTGRKRGVWRSVLLILLAASSAAAFAADADLAQAQALLNAGRAAEAYALLAPHEDAAAGDTRFDYLLGVSALDSGKPDKATLAFERVLAVDPNFAGARLDMARAYYQLGDLSRAKAEFETVLQQKPPEAARLTIERYLEAIAQREKVKQTVVTAFAELTVGRDSNVNNSTSESQVAVPALGNLVFTLNPTNVKRSDSYGLLAAGADIAHEWSPGYAVFGGASARYRGNSSADQFDYKSAEGHGGIAISGPSMLFKAILSGEHFYLDNAANRNTLGLGADLRYQLNPANFANVFGQYTSHRFQTQELSVNNFDQMLIGAGWQRLFGEGRSALSVTLFAGRENAVSGRADGDKDILGLRLGGQLNLREGFDAFASAGWQHGDYKLQNVAFQATRDDKLVDAVAGLIWRLSKAWSVRPQVLYIQNDSNIPIYAYNRTDYSVTLRYDFR